MSVRPLFAVREFVMYRSSIRRSSIAVPCVTLVSLISSWPCASQGQERRPAPRDGVRVTRNIDYVGDENPRQTLDLHLPAERAGDEPLPVVAFVHGGGWRSGDKRSGGGRLARLVASGRFAGVSIGYRLSGEATWPAQIHDCKAAIRWIRANAATHGLDPDKIAVWGTSAGGHLVAMLGTSGDVEPLEGTLGPHTKESSRVTCVVDFFGPTDFLTMNDHESRIDHDAPGSPESRLVGGAIQEHQAKARSAAPLTYVGKDDAPHLIVHGTADPLVPYQQSVALDEALDRVGVPSILVTMQEGGHGFQSRELDERVRAFLERHLHGVENEISDAPIKVAPRRR